jgi:hypothetical protein
MRLCGKKIFAFVVVCPKTVISTENYCIVVRFEELSLTVCTVTIKSVERMRRYKRV